MPRKKPLQKPFLTALRPPMTAKDLAKIKAAQKRGKK